MHEHYGIDIEDEGLLDRRSGRWLSIRILGLLAVDSRLRDALAPAPKKAVVR